MVPFFDHFRTNYVVLVLAAFAAAMLLHFIFQYVLRAMGLRYQLRRLQRTVTRLRSPPAATIKSELSRVFKGTAIGSAWIEFEETLHEQYGLVAGERTTTDVRATLPAEAFINLENVVDPRLGSEYFKHLPGILTGLGIIGTFYGLIQGLTHFDPSLTDTIELRRSVTGLFGHVQDAFTFSAIAIFCAILVTIAEKWLYSSCAKWLSKLSQSIDALFRAGVGEEYLSGLLRASQDSATQVRQLKEAIVEDLKTLLTNLTDRQIAATQTLSADLGQRIQESLKEPLADIARTVREASGRQSEAVGSVLEQLMTSFLAQMRESMGGQLGDLSGLLQRSAAAMASVERAMQGLVADMRQAGVDSSTSVQSAVRDLVQQLAEHQRTQSASVSSATAGVMAQLQDALGRIAAAQEESAVRARASDEATSAEMRNRVALIADANAATMSATRETLDRLGTVSGEMIGKLSAGAGAVAAAVGSLQGAAERMASLAGELSSLQGATRQSSQSMAQASAQLAVASEQVAHTVSQLATASTRLEGVAKTATTETDARNQLLRDLQELIGRSKAAGAEFAQLSQQVRKTLEENIETFGSGVSKVLSEHLRDYQKQLGDAVGMLRGALEELAEYATADRE
jgi:hypothetical protein